MPTLQDVACYKCNFYSTPIASEPCKSCDYKEFHGNFKEAAKDGKVS